MRIIAIGLGGAGCRIADSLYAIDRKSSRVACVQALAVDVDETTLEQLTAIPNSLKMYFPPFDPTSPDQPGSTGSTATIDIAEIVTRVHNFESAENDAIVLCCGLGGRMADIMPHVIAALRSSIVEPIFGLVTLPCRAEGRRRSSKAADDIDILSPLLNGIILFDNETWYKRTKAAAQERSERKERGIAQILGFGKQEPVISPELATYHHLNEVIVRRISLILKAGEFRADGGIDLAEVVLDSGEVLNTMKDGGFITIGYAVEKLPSNPLAFLPQLRPAGLFDEESKKRASRIVELAKQAIYHEVSTPCDMTSAHKALVLIAGPSHELSMQGFMTVRKWIDRSIRGLETRSGDYPVMNTKNVAIIIMLSGLENIPRINELREIREQGHVGPAQEDSADDRGVPVSQVLQDQGSLRDEMIVLPTKMQRGGEIPVTAPASTPRHIRPEVSETSGDALRVTQRHGHPMQQPINPQEPVTPVQPVFEGQERRAHPAGQQRPVPPVEPEISSHRRVISPEHTLEEQRQGLQEPTSQEHPQKSKPPSPQRIISGTHATDMSRQRIEQELQRQRMMALSGSHLKTTPRDSAAIQNKPSAVVRPKRVIVPQDSPIQPVAQHPARTDEDKLLENVKRTVIIHKRTPVPESVPTDATTGAEFPDSTEQTPESTSTPPGPEPDNTGTLQIPGTGERPVFLKEQTYRARDGIFTGKNVRESAVPKARDASLLHTNLKIKKPSEQAPSEEIPNDGSAGGGDESHELHHGKKAKKPEDLSRI